MKNVLKTIIFTVLALIVCAAAAGCSRPGRGVQAAVKDLLLENGRSGDVAIIEGVMGYYDGVAMGHRASAYDLSQQTATPAVLVVDGRGAALSLAALVKGFLSFRPDSTLRAVIFNQVSPMLYPRLKACIEAETGWGAVASKITRFPSLSKPNTSVTTHSPPVS